MTRNSLRIWGICFLAGASFGLGPSPAGSVQDELVDKGRRFLELITRAEFTAAVEDFDATMQEKMPAGQLEKVWGTITRQAGGFQELTGTRLESAGGFTVKEESVDDALAAAALLRRTPGIAPDKVFVLGHSLGGMLIPRIGRLDPEAAGFIILAGATRKGEEAIIKQVEYIASLDGSISEDESDRLQEYRNTAARIKELRPEDLGSEEVLFGAYAAYWLDLRDYDPPLSARDLKRPLLILQGERDYQVTTEDYHNWKTGLEGVPGAAFKLYPTLNHLFMPGRGKIRPAEYQRHGNVLEEVIEDIAAWIKTGHVQETR